MYKVFPKQIIIGILFLLQMTPINLVRHNSLELQQFGGDCIDDSLSMDTQDIIDQPAFTSITEIAVGVNFLIFFTSSSSKVEQ